MRRVIVILIALVFISCLKNDKSIAVSTSLAQRALINPYGKTVKSRVNPPKGYLRSTLKENSFQSFLHNFPVKPHGSQVRLYSGRLKNRQDVHAAILDISVGKRDLQQCADATMRLWAEYLYKEQLFEDIHFNFTNGFNAKYLNWRQGKRIKVTGNAVTWIESDEIGNSRASFDQYLRMVFSYAGTLSLEKEMKKVNIEELQIGDVFIQGGSPGHAVIVVDRSKNENGEILFLLAQSYMPAQEIHILKNLNVPAISPWYRAENLEILKTPEWTFSKHNLRRFNSKASY